MKLHIFNPENDLALADGGANYCPTPAAARIAYDLASLPLWFADEQDCVVLPDDMHREYHREVSSLFAVASPYNSDMCALYIMADVGTEGNSVSEAARAGERLADAIAESLYPQKK